MITPIVYRLPTHGTDVPEDRTLSGGDQTHIYMENDPSNLLAINGIQGCELAPDGKRTLTANRGKTDG